MKSHEIVSLLAKRIQSGEMAPGDRLPTHRDMAWDLKCSVGTVTRAYAELERRGAVYGHVGRGTYVAEAPQVATLEKSQILPLDPANGLDDDVIDLSLNRFYHHGTGRAYADALQDLALSVPQHGYQEYLDSRGREIDLEYARQWLTPMIKSVDRDNIIVTQGAQSGLFLTIGALTKPGDVVATEAFGYPGIKASAQELNLKIAAIEMDEEGLIPEAFAAAIKRSRVKLLVTVPTNHNPTGTTQSLARRQAILKIATEANIPIVEDGVYAPFDQSGLPTYWELDPENTLFLTSFSKVFSPGLRIGYVVAPQRLMPRLAGRMTAINWMTSPITLDLANNLIHKRVIDWHRTDLLQDGEKRFDMARKILGKWFEGKHSVGKSFLPHLWVRVPANLALTQMIELARDRNVTLIGGDRFAMNRQQDEHFVRICLMAVPQFQKLEEGLNIVAEILSGHEDTGLIS